ncbi:protein phosphatase regulatory subunit Sds22 [Sorochytrium milnesiophthora]
MHPQDTAGQSENEVFSNNELDDREPPAEQDEGEVVDESQFLADMATDVPRLSMRQNLFHKMADLSALAPALTELDLYDNRLSKVEAVKALTHLEYLDLSFNRIKTIPTDTLVHLSNLRDLFFVANKIGAIENLDGMPNLRNLELGANRIRSNRITKIEGLDKLQNLEELYLSHNGIKVIEGLEHNVKLRVLDITNNQIEHLGGVKHLAKLEELWASNNKIGSWQEVESEVKPLTALGTLYLEGNPLQRESMATYRNKLQLMLPNLRQIDATFVRR